MNANIPRRVHYYKGQFLRSSDFSDEQAYHISMRRRHNIAHHTWGIVHGLKPTLQEDENRFYIEPGIAIDGYGRELILSERQPLSNRVFDERGSDRLDVYLVYGLVETDGREEAVCEGDTVRSSRTEERPQIRLERFQLGVNYRKPREVPGEDHGFSPAQHPPDDPSRPWPVFLGQIIYLRADNRYTVNLAERPYAGLVGEKIETPNGKARVDLGVQNTANPNHRTMAVYLNTEKEPQLQIDAQTPNANRAATTSLASVTLRGRTEVHGDVTVVGGTLGFQAISPEPQVNTTPTEPQPWRMYRVRDSQTSGSTNELRVEMPGSSSGTYSVVFGAWSPVEKRFMPCLTITNECDVIVHGRLIASKIVNLNNQPIFQTPLSAQALDQLNSIYKSGVSGAAAHGRLQSLAGETAASKMETIEAFSAAPQDSRSLAQQLVDSDKDAVASELKNIDETCARKLRDALNNVLGDYGKS